MIITTPILPNTQTFAKRFNRPHKLDLEAICIFVATGFFMGEDTYWKDEVCLLPAHNHEIDSEGYLIASTPNFKWHYSPRNMSFEAALEEYVELLTAITKDQVGDSPVILPLSGGLDSRSQAAVLKGMPNSVQAFSYAFQNGYREDKLAKQIAKVCGFDFSAYTIPKGYLWAVINKLANINGCYSEFTHPRQMAILPELKRMDGVFSLGHWGDVLFDRGTPEGTTKAETIHFLFKKMVKPKGFELGQKLWKNWGLDGDFKSYLISRIQTDLKAINVDNVSSKSRAYKTSQWAHRWTTTNLSVFEAAHPITLPYYDNRMVEFICTVPETYLKDRRLQIAHLKKDKQLSNITWHSQKPFNINNHTYNKAPFNIPYQIISKLHRQVNGVLGKPYIQRNWELQFVGSANDQALKKHIFNASFYKFIPEAIVRETYQHFLKTDPINYAHPLSMLLTLSVWNKQNSL